MADDDTFDSVQWNQEDDDHLNAIMGGDGMNGGPSSQAIAGPSSEPLQAGPNADNIDLAGVGRGRLETTVSDPVTENEGTKDAYVSYRVTTDVSAVLPDRFFMAVFLVREL